MNLYDRADKIIEQIKKQINAEFANESNLLPFDELNVVKVRKNTTALYKRLMRYNRKQFERIARDAYERAMREAKLVVSEENENAHEFPASKIVTAMLIAYNPVTRYQYNNEAVRKRDRLVESVVSSNNRLAVKDAYLLGAKHWLRQSKQYADFSVDEARLAAMEDAGIRHVKWISQIDGKVCDTCKERNGQIYSIDEVPDKPHCNCRCTIEAVD